MIPLLQTKTADTACDSRPLSRFFGWGLGTRLGLPCFFLFFSLHSYTDARKRRKRVRPVMWHRHKVDVGGTVSDNKYVCTPPPLHPPRIYLTSFTYTCRCSCFSSLFSFRVLYWMQTKEQKKKKRGGLRMRLLSVLMRERMTCQPTTVQVPRLC